MVLKNIEFSVDEKLYKKFVKKIKKKNYENIEDYFAEMMRREVNRKASGGRPPQDIGSVVMARKKIFTTKGGSGF